MIDKRIVQIWSCWLFVVIQQIHSNAIQTQLMSLCNQTVQFSSSLSLIFTPTSYSSCCNVTIRRASSNLSELIFLNVNQMLANSSPLKIFDDQLKSVNLTTYSTWNRTLMKSDVLQLPIIFSLCRFDVSPFEIFLTKIFKGPCASNQFSCSSSSDNQWCIDDTFHCDGFHSCPHGLDESNCSKIHTRLVVPKMKRTIRGGVVTTIIVFGLLLIISSVSIAVAFVYFRRKRQRRRQFTYSLESTSDDWEPSGTGYHLFDNWTTNRRSPVPNDVNEHLPITTIVSNR